MMRPHRLVLLGHPVAHSLSPTFQQPALDERGIALRYTALDVTPEALPATLLALRAEGAAGNITVPHKVAAVALCDVVSETAQRVGAVNTFWTDASGRLCGDNTDVDGFEAAVATHLSTAHPALTGRRVMVLGAGGAALAVREAIRRASGASLVVAARRIEQAQAFAQPLGARAEAVVWRAAGERGLPIADSVAAERAIRAAVAGADVIVNTTPLGLHVDDALPLPPEWISPHQSVLDLAYRRDGPTDWVAACRARGIAADDGLGLLLEQGALAFERWFGGSAPRDLMRAAIGR
jgi:shikimate dehydrogenase